MRDLLKHANGDDILLKCKAHETGVENSTYFEVSYMLPAKIAKGNAAAHVDYIW